MNVRNVTVHSSVKNSGETPELARGTRALPWLLAAVLVLIFQQVEARRWIPKIAAAGGGATILTNVLQWTDGSSSLGEIINNNGIYFASLPEPTQSGNAILLGFQAGTSSSAFNVGDDKTNTYRLVNFKNDAGNAQSIYQFMATNVVAGAQALYVTNKTGGAVSFVSIIGAMEVSCLGAVDKTNGNNATSATLTAGSTTPTVANDFVWQVAAADSGTLQHTFTVGSQANITWVLAAPNRQEGTAMQSGVYSSTSALNPTFTASASAGFVSGAVFIKTGSWGNNRPTTPYIASLHHESQPGAGAGAAFGGIPVSQNQIWQWPTEAGLLVMAYSAGVTNFQVTNIVDSASTWVQASGGMNNNGAQDMTQWWYVTNAAASVSGLRTNKYYSVPNPGDATMLCYNVVNGTSLQYDTRTSSTGNQGSAGTLSAPPAITPAASGGIVIAQELHEFNTAKSVSGGSLWFDSQWFQGINQDGPQNVDENNGWAHVHPANTSSISAVWSFLTTADSGYANEAIQVWAADAISFKP
jgi:hypothetical protein